MKGIFRRFLAPALLGALLPWPAAHGQDALEGLAAVVNAQAITFSEVRELIAPRERHAQATLTGEALVAAIKDIRLTAINDLIDRSLILQEFDTRGLTVPPHVIDDQVQAIIKDSFGGDRQAFLRTLNAQGMTLDRFRQTQQESFVVQEMRRQAAKSVTTITEQQEKEYYRTHPEEFTIPEAVKLRMIVIREPGEKGSRRQMIEQMREKILAGADFNDLTRMSPPGEEREPDLGWIDRDTLNEALTKAAFALKPGDLSPVVEADGSYYLLLCDDKRPAALKSFEEARPEIEKELLQSERQKVQQEWLLKLRKKAFIKIY